LYNFSEMERLKKQFETMIVFSPKVAKVVGNVDTAIFLHQMLYWWERKTSNFVYKTIAEFQNETLLSRFQQDASIKKLVEIGFIEVFLQGSPPKRHFKVDVDKILEALENYNCKKPTNEDVRKSQIEHSNCEKITNAFDRNQPIDLLENNKCSCEKLTNEDVRKQQILYTEITTEITSENTSENTTKITFNKSCEKEFSLGNKKNNLGFDFKENISSKKEKERKPPNSAGSPFDEIQKTSLHSRMKEYFIAFFKTRTANDYYWGAKDGTNLKSIIQKFEYLAKKKNQPFGEDEILQSFQHLLTGVETDDWIMKNLSVSIVNMKFNELVSKINYNKNARKSETTTGGIVEELRNEFYARVRNFQSDGKFQANKIN